MPVIVKDQDIIASVDALRSALVSFDDAETKVIEASKIVEGHKEVSEAARQTVLDAISALQVLLNDIQARYSQKSPSVPEVESSHVGDLVDEKSNEVL